jgi:ATP-dependent Lon protease
MAGSANRILIPIIPLPRGSVLLPGVTHRIPIENRPDIPALLSATYSDVATSRRDGSTVVAGCVPLCSPLLSPEGQKLLEDSEDRVMNTARQLADPGAVKLEKDLFVYGTTVKITGVQGRRQSELKLVVEGLQRFRVERFTQFKPYVECEVTVVQEEGK